MRTMLAMAVMMVVGCGGRPLEETSMDAPQAVGCTLALDGFDAGPVTDPGCTVDSSRGLYVSMSERENHYFMLSLSSSVDGLHQVPSTLDSFFHGGDEAAISGSDGWTDMLSGSVRVSSGAPLSISLSLTDRRTGAPISGLLTYR